MVINLQLITRWNGGTTEKRLNFNSTFLLQDHISRYVSTTEPEPEIDLSATHKQLVEIEKEIRASTAKHHEFLKELGLSPLPTQATENRE